MPKTNRTHNVNQLDDWREIADQIQTILTELTVSIVVQDNRGRLMYANQAARDRLRYPTSFMENKRPHIDPTEHFDIYTQSDVKVRLDELPSRRVLRGEEWSEAVLHFIAKDGNDEFWLMIKAVPVKDEMGTTKYVITISNNITALKQTEVRLRANNDRLMKMLENVMDSNDFDGELRRRGGRE